MRTLGLFILCLLLWVSAGLASEPEWVAGLNARFPNIGTELWEAVQQKLQQHGGDLTVEQLIAQFEASPDYAGGKIVNAKSFGLHSELMLLYPAVGKYPEALREAKLLRDFILKYPPDDPNVVQTFRGVYAELLILNGQYEEALQECAASLLLNPAEEGVYLTRGIAHVNLQQLEQALEDLRILLRKPDPKNYAQQLFDFIMAHRQSLQEPQVQEHTMIDVLLRDLEPKPGAKIKIPARPQPDAAAVETPQTETQQAISATPQIEPTPTLSLSILSTQTDSDLTGKPTPGPSQEGDDPLARLLQFNADTMAQELGAPISELEGKTMIEREYEYHGEIVTIGFDKIRQNVVLLQMFFFPAVEETEAFMRIGVIRRDLTPLIENEMQKVWSPYGEFAKVRVSIENGKVLAIVVEP